MKFMPIDGRKIISSKEALVLRELPESMAVVGSGAIGCEFAYFYASLGVKVTVIEYLPQLLPAADTDVSKALERAFRKMKIGVMTGTTVKDVTVNGDGKCELRIEGKKGEEILTADIVLSAVGIKSNLEGLGLEEAGITLQGDKITVDDFYRTNVEGVYAIGDIVHGPALAHVASAEAICCVEKICGHAPAPIDYTTIPSCVYTTPEIAMVGLTEKQAIEGGYEIKVGQFPYTASGKATAAGDRDGFVKTAGRPHDGGQCNGDARRTHVGASVGSDGAPDSRDGTSAPHNERSRYGGCGSRPRSCGTPVTGRSPANRHGSKASIVKKAGPGACLFHYDNKLLQFEITTLDEFIFHFKAHVVEIYLYSLSFCKFNRVYEIGIPAYDSDFIYNLMGRYPNHIHSDLDIHTLLLERWTIPGQSAVIINLRLPSGKRQHSQPQTEFIGSGKFV